MNGEIVYDGFFKVVIINAGKGPRERIEASDSVNILLFDRVNKRIILARQVREAMIREDNPGGLITETAAGRFDVDLSPKALMVKEANEEVGVTITEDQIELLNFGFPMALSAGVITERAYLGFAEVTPDQIEEADRVFGVDKGEYIKRIYIPADQLGSYVCEDLRVYAFIQFLKLKLEKEHKNRRE